jgi:hypothetical protein
VLLLFGETQSGGMGKRNLKINNERNETRNGILEKKTQVNASTNILHDFRLRDRSDFRYHQIGIRTRITGQQFLDRRFST